MLAFIKPLLWNMSLVSQHDPTVPTYPQQLCTLAAPMWYKGPAWSHLLKWLNITSKHWAWGAPLPSRHVYTLYHLRSSFGLSLLPLLTEYKQVSILCVLRYDNDHAWYYPQIQFLAIWFTKGHTRGLCASGRQARTCDITVADFSTGHTLKNMVSS